MAFDWALWGPVILGGVLAGGSTATLGVHVVAMRVPFLGVCVSHAALAGAVFGALAGLTGPALLAPALLTALAAALALGLLDERRLRADANAMMGVLFSLTMGLALLGLGLFSKLGRSDHEALGLLWGSLTYCTWRDVSIMAGSAALQAVFLALLYARMRAILISRELAAAAGVHVTAVWTAFLVLAALVITVNFKTVGGLMIYSLMTNPSLAAFQLVKGYGRSLLTAALLGVTAGLGGFGVALWLGVPTGAAIVILSSAMVGAARLLRRG